jgi:hypothetical protein
MILFFEGDLHDARATACPFRLALHSIPHSANDSLAPPIAAGFADTSEAAAIKGIREAAKRRDRAAKTARPRRSI